MTSFVRLTWQKSVVYDTHKAFCELFYIFNFQMALKWTLGVTVQKAAKTRPQNKI